MSKLYDTIGRTYSSYRKPDPRIAAEIYKQIGGAEKIVNIGAGVGSYEPQDRNLVAVEPSRLMISQRKNTDRRVIRGQAESLPFKDGVFDLAMAILTTLHWSDLEKGLGEALRVANGRILLLTWIGFVEHFWLLDYFPEMKVIDESLFPTAEQLEAMLGPLRVIPVPIPWDCTDGFLCAYWRRPRRYLDHKARRAISTFSRLTNLDDGLKKLEKDLESGLWNKDYHHLLDKEYIDYGYRLICN